MSQTEHTLSQIRRNAYEILDNPQDFDALINAVGDSHFVLLGEATRGTHEFYKARAQFTLRLIEEKSFSAVAVEADWFDACRVNRYVRSISDDSDPMTALNDFKGFPQWMWRNTDVADFISVLKYLNEGKTPQKQVGFYGLDLYGLYASFQKIIQYLDGFDPDAAEKARQHFSGFEQYGPESTKYGMAKSYVSEESINQVVKQLEEIRRIRAKGVSDSGFTHQEELFFTDQNAKMASDAEVYYRTMFSDRVSSWNLRDKYMCNTINSLANHINQYKEPKIIIWEHNSHIGDARATEANRYGELNVGQLIREKYKADAFLIGFTTNRGTVAAASFWDGPVEKKDLTPSLVESYEHLFHRSEIPDFYLLLRNNEQLSFLQQERLQRAIGAVYMPKTEPNRHYFNTSITNQFDAVIHFDHTMSIQPLDRNSGWE